MANNPMTSASRNMYIAAGYLMLALGFAGLAVLPYARAMNAAKADIARFDEEIAARKEKVQELADIRRRIELIDLQTRNYDRLVPANQDFGNFMGELSRELNAAGIRERSVSAMPSTPLGKSQRLPIELRGKGTFAQFHEFLVRLEGLKRMSSVGKLMIDADTDMNGEVTAQVMLFIYNTKVGS